MISFCYLNQKAETYAQQMNKTIKNNKTYNNCLSVDFLSKTIDVTKKWKTTSVYETNTENLSTTIFLRKNERTFGNHPLQSKWKKHVSENISKQKKETNS